MRIGLAFVHSALAASSKGSRLQFTKPEFTRATLAMSSESEVMQVKRLSEHAIMPARGSRHAAGFDLSSAYDAVVPAGRQAIVKTDLAIAIPAGTYARIAPRSGLAVKKMIDVGAGVVDYDYRGPVGVVLFNHGSEDFRVKRGDRVAQLILERICMAGVQEVELLSETERGSGGFGSTGVGKRSLEPSAAINVPKKIQATELSPLAMMDYFAGELKMPKDSSLIMKLRKIAINFPSRFASSIHGPIERYEETGDAEELRLNLELVI